MTVRARAWVMLAVLLGSLAAVPVAGPARAAASAPAEDTWVKYYTVQSSYQGQPENLNAIAARFLDSPGRASDIVNLNVGRRQADGGALGADGTLRPGWSLILPWDAVGEGVRYGALPRTTPATDPTGAVKSPPRGGTKRPPADRPGRGKQGPCRSTAAPRDGANWAQQRIAAEQAWQRTRGQGVLVAVVDSGVDGRAPELAGRVAPGADIVAGSGKGNSDCLGSGTAMAGIVAADPGDGAGPSVAGVAPEAVILPIRVIGDAPRARASDAATGVEVAVSAGAKVIALGAYVDLGDRQVAAAVAAALKHDVVVVVAAPTRNAGESAEAQQPAVPGLIRVGGVGPQGQPAAGYRPGAVDVVAPGIDVASLGVEGVGIRASSGSQYAVAFVAGAVALVRAGFPNLDAAQVVHRVKASADGAQAPEPATGHGMINVKAAVTLLLPEAPSPAAVPRSGWGVQRVVALALVTLLGMGAVALLLRRRTPSAAPSRSAEPGHGPR